MMDIPRTPRPGGAAPGGAVPASDRPASGAAHPAVPRAGHGDSSEVRWHSGQGRQPYANRGFEEEREPNLGDAFEAGNRGLHAGVTLEQTRQVKQRP